MKKETESYPGNDINIDPFALAISGIQFLRQAVASEFLIKLLAGISEAQVDYQKIHENCGYTESTDGGLHHILSRGGVFFELLKTFPGYNLLSQYFSSRFVNSIMIFLIIILLD